MKNSTRATIVQMIWAVFAVVSWLAGWSSVWFAIGASLYFGGVAIIASTIESAKARNVGFDA